jgi:NTP pyrophosphatase (non-canonical NTP hydrolase)
MRLNHNDLQAEIAEINRANGWYDDERPWSADISLLHTEVSEMVEAYRDHELADATVTECPHGFSSDNCVGDHPLPKPEGVGSEAADVLIRLLDTANRYGITGEEVRSHGSQPVNPRPYDHFTDATTALHFTISQLWLARAHAEIDDSDLFAIYARRGLGGVYRILMAACAEFEIDLDFEVTRKNAYNRTRSYRHGGRVL